MIAILLGIFMFILTIPFRSALFVVNANIKSLETKGKLKEVKDKVSGQKHGKTIKDKLKGITKNSRSKLKVESLTKKERMRHKALLTLRNGLKATIAFINSLSAMMLVIVMVIIIIIIAVLVTMISSMGVLQVAVMNGGFTTTVQNAQNVNAKNQSSKKSSAVTEADIDGWLSSCSTVWKHFKEKGYTYSYGGTTSDSKYGKVRKDCTGYVYTCLKEAGYVKSPSDAMGVSSYDFANFMKGVKGWEVIAYNDGVKMKKGDIVIYNGHVCIYAGGDKYFNNASVRHCPTSESGPYSCSWQTSNFKSASGKYLARLTAVTNAGGNTGKKLSKLTYPSVGEIKTVPWMCQGDYSNVKMTSANGAGGNYGSNSIASSGCGFTALAMVSTWVTGEVITPKDTLKKCGSAYHGEGMESSTVFNDSWWAKKLGIDDKVKSKSMTSLKQAKSYGQKYPLIVSVRSCKFTDNCHYIVVRGITSNGKCYVNDPNGRSRGSRYGMSAEQWLNNKFDFESDVWNHKNSGCWAIIPK